MKKFTKTLTASVLAAAATANMFAVPVSHVAYADEAPAPSITRGDVINVTNKPAEGIPSIPSTGKVGKLVTIPNAKATAIGGGDTTISNLKAVVTRPDGREVPVSVGENTSTFEPKVAGNYYLVYEGTNSAGVKTTSKRYVIKVTADTYTMSLAPNSSIILPSTVDTKASRFTGGVIKEVVLPNPTVTDKNGYDIIVEGAINPIFAEYIELKAKVTASTATPTESERYTEISNEFKKYSLIEEDITLYAGCTLNVTVTTESKEYDSRVSIDNPSTGEYILMKEGKNYYFTPEQGTNVIHYTLVSKTGAALASLTKTVVGSNTYDHTKINLGFSAADRPTKASLNDKVYLPLASGYDKANANNAVTVETIFEVNLDDNGEVSSVELKEDEDGVYFIPTVKGGDYEIVYKVKDYYGNESKEYSYWIENVKDGKAPTMYLVGAYAYADVATTADAIIAMQNAEYMIPTKVGRNVNSNGILKFPAMFGVDSVVDFDNLSFSRSISSTNLDSSVNLLLNKYLVGKEGVDLTTITKDSERATFEAQIDLNELDDKGKKVYPAGEYTVTYTIGDRNGYSASKSYKFVIEEDFVDSQAPVVTYGSNFPTLLQSGQEVSIAKPTVTDTVDGAVKVNYYVVVGDKELDLYPDEDGNLTFNMNDYLKDVETTIYDYAISNKGGNKISIKTVAVDDYGNTTTKAHNITVRNEKDDQAIVVRESATTDFAAGVLPTIENDYVQNSYVTAAGVTFVDNDANLEISVIVRDGNGNRVTGVAAIGAIEKKVSGDDTIYAHPGVKFKATKAESYTVTYMATDAGNNIVVYTVQLPVLADSENPSFEGVSPDQEFTIELGQKLDLGRVTVVDNSSEDITPVIVCESNPEYVNGTIFAPTENGTYTVKYTAEDSHGNKADPVSVKVIVQDTTAPVLTINNKDNYPTTFKSQTTTTDAKDFTAIELPSFSAADETFDFGIDADSLDMSVTATMKIVGPDSKEYTVDNTNAKYKITYNDVNDVYSFVPTQRGTYTVTYSAFDKAGNKAEDYIIKVMVGDTVLPTVNYTGTLSANIKVGDKITIDDRKITITDNIEDEDLTYTSIEIVDQSGNTLTPVKEELGEGDDAYTLREYTFEKAGTYTLTIRGRDTAGNDNTYTYKITVTTDATSNVFKDNVGGVVVIVISLLILAGVIIYFAKTKKKVTSPKKTAKKVETKTTEAKAEEKKD